MAEGDTNEIYRVNKLLAIEDLDWSHQLTQAVSFVSTFVMALSLS